MVESKRRKGTRASGHPQSRLAHGFHKVGGPLTASRCTPFPLSTVSHSPPDLQEHQLFASSTAKSQRAGSRIPEKQHSRQGVRIQRHLGNPVPQVADFGPQREKRKKAMVRQQVHTRLSGSVDDRMDHAAENEWEHESGQI